MCEDKFKAITSSGEMATKVIKGALVALRGMPS